MGEINMHKTFFLLVVLFLLLLHNVYARSLNRNADADSVNLVEMAMVISTACFVQSSVIVSKKFFLGGNKHTVINITADVAKSNAVNLSCKRNAFKRHNKKTADDSAAKSNAAKSNAAKLFCIRNPFKRHKKKTADNDAADKNYIFCVCVCVCFCLFVFFLACLLWMCVNTADAQSSLKYFVDYTIEKHKTIEHNHDCVSILAQKTLQNVALVAIRLNNWLYESQEQLNTSKATPQEHTPQLSQKQPTFTTVTRFAAMSIVRHRKT